MTIISNAVLNLTPAQEKKALLRLSFFHIFFITASNYLVQRHFEVFGLDTTWGTFTFPFIFLATDLTVRIFGAHLARRIIFFAMIPALIISYMISVLFHDSVWQGWEQLRHFDSFAFRIALASFGAYAFGQLLDVLVFNRLRQLDSWWVAPSASTVLGNALDTLVFFAVAFFQSSDPFMAEHWPQIALLDYAVKIVVSGFLFLPIYGLLLNYLSKRITAD